MKLIIIIIIIIIMVFFSDDKGYKDIFVVVFFWFLVPRVMMMSYRCFSLIKNEMIHTIQQQQKKRGINNIQVKFLH